MPRLYLLAGLLFASVFASAQTTLGYLNFESLPAGFTTTGWNNSSSDPSTGYTGAGGGKNLAEQNNQTSSTFTTPSVTVTGYSNLTLSFGIRKSSVLYLPIVTLEYSTNNGTTWQTIPATVNATTTWALQTIQLGGLVSNVSQIRFRFNRSSGNQSNGNNKLQVDDMKLTGVQAIPLPIELISFTGREESDNRVRLDWEIAPGDDAVRFDVERSTNTTTFINVAAVPAEDDKFQYTYGEERVGFDRLFYRLQMLDRTGKRVTSRVVIIPEPKKGDSTLYIVPSVIQTDAHMQFFTDTDQDVQLQITDAEGRQVMARNYSVQRGVADIRFDGASVQRGTYFVRIVGKDQTVRTGRFIRF